jgi:hypothetical protein
MFSAHGGEDYVRIAKPFPPTLFSMAIPIPDPYQDTPTVACKVYGTTVRFLKIRPF